MGLCHLGSATYRPSDKVAFARELVPIEGDKVIAFVYPIVINLQQEHSLNLYSILNGYFEYYYHHFQTIPV